MDKGDEETPKVVEPLTKKQELNNHIVLMRKVVRRARLHLINKLTKELKKLKDRKGDPKAQEKAKRKADRLLQEIQVIKHLKEDKVSIYALQDKTTLEETLQKSTSTTEDRALARLGHHQFVTQEVKKYRESNPYWELQIPVLLEKSKDKRKQIDKKLAEREALKGIKNSQPNLSKKSDKVQEDSVQADSGLSEDQSSHSSAEEEEVDQDEIKEELDQDDIKEEVDQDEIKEEVVEDKINKKEVLAPLLPPLSKKPKLVKTPAKLKKAPAAVATKKSTPSTKPIEKTEGTVRVQVLKDLTDLEEKPKPLVVQLTTCDLTQVVKKRPKSSFFEGGVDEPDPVEEEYQTQRKNPRRMLPPSSSNPSDSKPIFRKGKLVNKGPSRFGKPDRGNKNPRFVGEKDSSNLVPLGNKPKQGKNHQSDVVSSTTAAAPAEKLHPSWEAKKRQQAAVTAFQGKKITFTDDD